MNICKVCHLENVHNRRLTISGHIDSLLRSAKQRAKADNLPFNLDLDFLLSIYTEVCPALNIKMSWCEIKKGNRDQSPSIDRIVPEWGYIKGNVVFLSRLANAIKSDATERELYAVADWLHDKRKEVVSVFKGQITSIPETNGRKGQSPSEHRALHGAGIGEDCDGSHHHIGV